MKIAFKNSEKHASAIFTFCAALLLISSQTMGQNKMETNKITIEEGSKVATLINVFTVDPQNTPKLINLFERGTTDLFSKQPGFISFSIHQSMDGNKIVLYGQWRSKQDIDRFRGVPEIQEYFREIKELGTFESIVCDEITNIHTSQK